jgi:hypothetical protein
MAKKLKTFTFAMGRGGEYDWDKWLDGSIWELHQGTDFTKTPRAVSIAAHQTAKRKGFKVHTNVRGDVLVIQAYEPD